MLIGLRPWASIACSAAAWSSGASSVTSPPISCAYCPGPRSSRSSAICASTSRHGVLAVDAHAVGVARVVARRAGEVAAREDAVRALAPGGAAAEHLVRRLDVRRQLLPAPRERRGQVRVLGAGGELERAQAGAHAHRAGAYAQSRPAARGTNGACPGPPIWTRDWPAWRSSWRRPAARRRSTTASGGSCTSRASSASSPATSRWRSSASAATRWRSAPPSCTGWSRTRSSCEWLRTNIPLMAHDTPGGADAIRALLPDEGARALGPLEPREPQTLWWGELTYLQPELPPAQTRYLTFALTEPDGERVGWAILYLPAAPASIVSLITRGNQGMFARMAELLQPARHETAILFADIQASSDARAPPLLAALVRADPRLPDRGRPGRDPAHGDRRPARRRRHDGVLPRRARRLARRGVRGRARGRARDRRLAPARDGARGAARSTPACTGAARSTSAR